MEHKSHKKKDEAFIIQTWGDYEFKLFPGSAKTKPYLHFQFLNPDTGKEVRQRKSTGLKPGESITKLKKEAKALSEAIIDLLSQGWNPINNTINGIPITPLSTIQECIEYWLTQREEMVKNTAMKIKALKMNKYLMGYFKTWLTVKGYLFRKPNSFNKIDIDNFLQTTASARKWGKVSYNCYRTDLGTFFNYLKTLKIISENPVKESMRKSTKNDSSRFKIYEEDELLDVVTLLAKDKRYLGLYVASKMVYFYNLRPIEITRIQVNNIDFQKKLLTLRYDQTKNKNEAIFQLNEEMFNLLDNLTSNYPSDYFVFGRRCKPSKLQVHQDYFGAKFHRFRLKHNISEHLKFYALKHSSNYWDLQDGASPEEIRQRNRHSSLQVTTMYIKERLHKNHIKPSQSNRF